MAKQIKGTDIIENNHLANAIKSAEDLLSVYKELDKTIRKTAEDVKKVSQGANTNRAEGIQKTTKALQDSNQVRKASLQIDKNIQKTEGQILALDKKRAQQLAINKKRIKEKNAAAKDEIVLNNKNAGTLERLQASSRKLRREREKLNLDTKKGQARLREINAELDRNNAKIKKNSDAMKRQRLNVGNYGSALQRVGGILKGFGVTLLATFSIRSIGRFFKASIDGFRVQEKAVKKVEQALKSTGNAAGKTSEELQKTASALQENSLFGDEQILNDVTAQLLTFTNIAGNEFDRTQQVALDLATVLDGDVKSASIQLGKALNDPVANLSALSRSGIQFSKEQKDLIKSLAETGKLAEAQAVILDELERQYGGQAKAAAEADGGIQQLKNTFGDLQEIIGKELIKAIKPIVTDLKQFIQNLDPKDVQAFARAIGRGIKQLAEFGKEVFSLVVSLSKAQESTGSYTEAIIRLFKFGFKPLFKLFGAPFDFILEKLGLADDLTRAWGDAIDFLGLRDLAEELGLVSEKLDEVSDAQARNNHIRENTAKISREIVTQNKEEIDNVSVLIDFLKDENTTREEREGIIAKLNEQYPETLANIDLETAGIEALDNAKKELIKTILKQDAEERKLEATRQIRSNILALELGKIGLDEVEDAGRIAELNRQRDEQLAGLERAEEIFNEVTRNLTEGVESFNFTTPVEKLNKEINKLKEDIKDLTDPVEIEQANKKLMGLIAERAELLGLNSEIAVETSTSTGKALTEEQKKLNQLNETRQKNAEILKKLERDFIKLGFEREIIDQELAEIRMRMFKDEIALIKELGFETTKELDETIEKANEFTLALQNIDKIDFKNLEKNIDDFNKKFLPEEEGGDLKFEGFLSIFDQVVDKEKEALKKRQEQLKKFRDESLKIFKDITDGLQKNIDERIQSRQSEITDANNNISRLQKLAQEGNTDAAEAIKAERTRIAKEKLEIEALEKRKRNLLIVVTALEKANQNISNGDTNAFANASQSINEFLQGLPSFSEGTVGTVAQALGRTGSKDGHVVRVDDREHILSIKDSETLHAAGLRTNRDIVSAAMMAQNNALGRKALASKGGYVMTDHNIVNELKDVKKAIKGIEITQQHIDLLGLKEVIKKGNKITKNDYNPKWKI